MITAIRKYAKYLIASTLYYTGVLHLLKWYLIKDKVIVLTYHRVLSEEEQRLSYSNKGILVLEGTFDWHIKFLKRNFDILSPDAFENITLGRSELSKASCLITFDDGWLDNYSKAFPILKKYSTPALIFLTTNYIGSRHSGFWQETLARLIDMLLNSGLPVDPSIGSEDIYRLKSSHPAIQKASILEFTSAQKTRAIADVNALIEKLLLALGYIDDKDSIALSVDRFMSWEHTIEMSSHGITYGSHTLSHKRLPFASREEAISELEDSKAVINEHLGITTRMIAYPNGDYNDSVIDIARESGYSIGFTTIRGLYCKNTSLLSIPRINIHDGNAYSPAMLMATILGIF